MPSFTILYTKYGNPIYELCKSHRNTVIKHKNSNYVIIGGFGNLNGVIDIWDLQSIKLIGSSRSNSATMC
jgi:uncharacterized protein with WD repeat